LISLSSIFSHYHFLFHMYHRYFCCYAYFYFFFCFLLVMQDTNKNPTVIILERDWNKMWNMVGYHQLVVCNRTLYICHNFVYSVALWQLIVFCCMELRLLLCCIWLCF
jgi:hypothetical protein